MNSKKNRFFVSNTLFLKKKVRNKFTVPTWKYAILKAIQIELFDKNFLKISIKLPRQKKKIDQTERQDVRKKSTIYNDEK